LLFFKEGEFAMRGNLILILALCFAAFVGYQMHDANVQPTANASTDTASVLPLPPSPADVGSTPIVDVSQATATDSACCPGGRCDIKRSRSVDVERHTAVTRESSATNERTRGERKLGAAMKAPIKAVGRLLFRRR
jgi:hypothetical protein